MTHCDLNLQASRRWANLTLEDSGSPPAPSLHPGTYCPVFLGCSKLRWKYHPVRDKPAIRSVLQGNKLSFGLHRCPCLWVWAADCSLCFVRTLSLLSAVLVDRLYRVFLCSSMFIILCIIHTMNLRGMHSGPAVTCLFTTRPVRSTPSYQWL